MTFSEPYEHLHCEPSISHCPDNLPSSLSQWHHQFTQRILARCTQSGQSRGIVGIANMFTGKSFCEIPLRNDLSICKFDSESAQSSRWTFKPLSFVSAEDYNQF
jgi:hypothetical protein